MKTQDVRQLFTLMVDSLSVSTGTPEPQKKVLAAWAVATHAIATQKLFPILVLRSPGGTGKSRSLSVIGNFCHMPRLIMLDGATLPSIRDDMMETRLGTLLVEEGDDAWSEESLRKSEALFNARYSIRTERTALKVQTTVEKTVQRHKETSVVNRTEERLIFGATAIHKRKPWKDANLNGKCVTVLFRPNLERDAESYVDFDPDSTFNKEGREIAEGGKAMIDLPYVKPPSTGIFGRVWDSWRPLVAVSALVKDSDFDAWLLKAMIRESRQLTMHQGEEIELVVLKAIIRHVFATAAAGETCNWGRIRISDLTRDLQDRRIDVNSHQFGMYSRELGFVVKNSGGNAYLYPCAPVLLDSCRSMGLDDDEEINQLQKAADPKIAATQEKENDVCGGAGVREKSSTRLLSGKDLAAGEKEEIEGRPLPRRLQ